jgi:nucleoside-diphosphate-sugar epimerase
MQHVLVTGASGFIGRNLVPALLDAGYAVTAFVRNPNQWLGPTHSAFNVVCGDIRDLEAVRIAVRRVDGVFHLAGATTSTSLAKSRAVNVGGMETLAEAIRSRPDPPKLVFVSSLAVAGAMASEGVTEEMECRPVSNYGKTKLEAEHFLRSVSQDVPATIVRPPCVFGPWDKNLLMVFRSVRRGWNLCAGSAKHRFSFLYVGDLIKGLISALIRGQLVRGIEDPKNTGVYYLAHPNPVPFPQIAEWIAPFFGRKSIRTVEIPLSLCWMVAAVLEGWGRITGRLPFINFDKLRDARVGSWTCGADRAASELPFQTRDDLKAQLEQTFEWYKGQGWLP